MPKTPEVHLPYGWNAEGDEQTTGAPIAILGNQEPSDRPGLLNELPRVVYRDPEVAVRGPLQPAAPHAEVERAGMQRQGVGHPQVGSGTE